MPNYDEMSMLELFQLECSELLKELDTLVLEYEHASDATKGINSIARIMHTLKGAASTVDCDSVKVFAHACEDYTETLKLHKQLASEHVDYFLQLIDWIRYLADLAVQEKEPDVPLQAICDKVREQAPLPQIPGKSSDFPEIQATEAHDVDIPAPEESVGESDKRSSPEMLPEGPLDSKGFQRISTQSLDQLLNLSGELYVKSTGAERLQNSMFHALKTANTLSLNCGELAFSLQREDTQDREVGGLLGEISRKSVEIQTILEPLYHHLDEFGNQLRYLTVALQEEVMLARMVPLSELFDTYPRLVRNLAKTLNKRVEWHCQGADTRIDKAIIESIKAPLEHLLRNALDHGIEPSEQRKQAGKPEIGRLALSAFHQGDQVIIRLKDDGKGINVEAIREKIKQEKRLSTDKASELLEKELFDFIFLPGFSTKGQVTATSGRGVGMDIVKTQIEKVNGQVRVESTLSEYTLVTIILPLTLAITRTLLLESNQQVYAFPTSHVSEYLHIALEAIEDIGGRPMVHHNDQFVPIVWLHQLLGKPSESDQDKKVFPGFLFGAGDEQIIIMAHQFIGEEEIIVKPLDARLKKVRNLIGATILNNGRIALVLDIADLFNTFREVNLEGNSDSTPNLVASSQTSILVIEDSLTVRELERKILSTHGYDVTTAVDGLDGLHKIRERTFDLIITDIDMPRMNGLELTKTLRADPKYQTLPIVIVSYKDRPEDKRKGLEVGASHYIGKSQFDNNEFLQAIEQLI